MKKLYIGTSGWVYKHWREIFYPKDLPQRKWFEYFAREFDTVEINNSFYRLPPANTFDGWRKQAPPGFLYAVKANRFLTHIKRLKEPEEPLKNFIENASHLGETLGPVLYQLPPRWRVDVPRFEYFLNVLPEGYTHVIEFRDESWFMDEVFELMERYGVAHCIHDKPIKVPLRNTGKLAYIRFHGYSDFGGDYPDEALKTWAERIKDWQNQGLEVFVYFNNDWYGFALKNARTLKELLV